ncbi:2-polyprenyl-6-methoxyphenol hydroxylase [Microbispora rosea]|uniref:2-polyprenyl-6-methoxyphenol hydroxylase n=1 Tax=Microbispora rosea TaxID=58117 RepID=A0A1N7F476_9ACTN|nr:FAD-dependent monooxygenase [Microbispora rosea]GIH48613.1 monooxygenase [Microbispora rosea subsp. rosea]SIR95133.1 2-polyprenyl-6-methoxyphenol hydroxylase [Microbispora rosea]
MRVIVIGAGLGGLALANGLRGTGVDVAVYERDASPVIRGQGYRLHLGDVGIDALASVLAPERRAAFVAAAHVPKPRFVRLDPALRVLEEHDFGGRHLSVDRQELRDTLLADVKGLITYGKRLTAFQAEAGQVTACFADGTTAAGDVLVGADGAGSAVRRQYLPHARVVGTGLTQLYGKIPRESAEDLDHVFSAVTGPRHRVVGIALTRDYATLSFSARSEELPSEPHLLRSLVMEMTSGWHPRIRRMLADWREIFPLVLRTSVPVAPWNTTRVTLLGDAAHALSPAGGAGANLALRDAASLAAALTAGHPLIPELRSYEREMIDSGFAAVRASAANGARILGQDPLPS